MSLTNTRILLQAIGGESFIIAGQSQNVPSGTLFSATESFANGTGAGKAQKWASIAISLAAGAQQTVDLTAATGLLGADVNFANIKAMILQNTNVEQEVDTVVISGSPTGGTYTVTIGGQTTAAIAYNAATSAVKTAIELLSTVGSGKSTISGTASSYTIALDSSLGLMTVSASGASLTGGTAPAATATHVASELTLGDDGSGSNVWSAIFAGTDARIICQPGEIVARATPSKAGYTVDSSHKSLLLTNTGAVAVTGVLVLLGEGA